MPINQLVAQDLYLFSYDLPYVILSVIHRKTYFTASIPVVVESSNSRKEQQRNVEDRQRTKEISHRTGKKKNFLASNSIERKGKRERESPRTVVTFYNNNE